LFVARLLPPRFDPFRFAFAIVESYMKEIIGARQQETLADARFIASIVETDYGRCSVEHSPKAGTSK
jgi:hypothetical protein